MNEDKGKIETPTLRDVCRASRLSLATLDRVVNKRPGVSQKTIDKALNAMAEVGYKPNIAARFLAKRRPAKVCFVYSSSDPFTQAFFRETERHLSLRSVFAAIETQILNAGKEKPLELPDDSDLVISIGVSKDRFSCLEGVDNLLLLDDPKAASGREMAKYYYDAGASVARSISRLVSRLNTGVGMLSSKNVALDELARRAGFVETLGQSSKIIRVATKLENLETSGIVYIARRMTREDLDYLRFSNRNHMFFSGNQNEFSLEALKTGAIDALSVWNFPFIIERALAEPNNQGGSNLPCESHARVMWAE